MLASKASGIGKNCQGRILELNSPICKLRKIQKFFITLDPGCTSTRVSILNLLTVLTDTSTKDDLKQPRSHTICWQGFRTVSLIAIRHRQACCWLTVSYLGLHSRYFIFFATYTWAQKAWTLHNTSLDTFARDKHSRLLGQFGSYEEKWSVVDTAPALQLIL